MTSDGKWDRSSTGIKKKLQEVMGQENSKRGM